MDTTLVTFMVQTSKSTRSVDLIGSWDNFTKHYHMEPDSKQVRGQWRGCHQFEDIICDGDGLSGSKRTGGLKMGSRYYYYYELDGGIEYHDATMPFTTSCPYLPGQPINYIWVPIEVPPLRDDSASMSSLRSEDLKTINPTDKYVHPKNRSISAAVPRSYTSTSILHNVKYSQILSTQQKYSSHSRVHSKECNVNLPKSDMGYIKCLKAKTRKRDNSLWSLQKKVTHLSAKDSNTSRKISTINSPSKESHQKVRFPNLFHKSSLKTKKRTSSLTSVSVELCPSSSSSSSLSSSSSTSTSPSVTSSPNDRHSLVSITSQISLPVVNFEDLSYTSFCLNYGDISIHNRTGANPADCYSLSSSDFCTRPIIPGDNSSWQKEKTVDSSMFDVNSSTNHDLVNEGASTFDSLRIEVGYLSDFIVA
ncbi:hypothetical protein OnM2_102013 [Erysiphe neolycopersici]|uniref:Uncharacterized protein n=1 Tax=Erysiphe neolycopersici TaxID=212602 RepID=A0A420H8L9_9PEZI|nr:hypothetical protein OnM2_102013 [Erysiphe neolycopersici]